MRSEKSSLAMLFACAVLVWSSYVGEAKAQKIGACEYIADRDFSMAMCVTKAKDIYSFAEMTVGLRDSATGEAAGAIPAMVTGGVDLDARCMISVTSKKLNWNDMPSDWRRMTLAFGENREVPVGFYGTTSTPEAGTFTAQLKCDFLEDIFLAESVTLTWSTKTSEHSFAANEESFSGFLGVLETVTASARSRRKE